MATEPTAKGSRLPQISRYQPLSRIATGGMGAVYKAVDVETGREVALKVLSPEWTSKPVLLKRFRLEALHGSQLGVHPHVVRFYEAGEAGGMHFLALEFVEGVDLKDYLATRGRLDVEEAQAIVLQAARAIEHLHHYGITHRDIKPSNFLVAERQGRPFVKLIDLGLARNVEDDEEARVTRVGTTLGTVDYIAPEQARNSGSADVRSDLYALGCTWFHLLTGQPPYPDGTVTERILKHIEAPPPDVRKLNPQVPRRTAKVLERLLAKDPDDRYQTPAELIRDLEALDEPEPALSSGVLAGLADGEGALADGRPRRTRRRTAGASDPLGVFKGEAPDRRAGARRAPRRTDQRPWWLAPVAAGAGCMVVALVAWLALKPRHEPVAPEAGEPPPLAAPQPAAEPASPPHPAPPVHANERPSEAPRAAATRAPEPVLRRLYQPPVPVDPAEVGREAELPWAAAPAFAAGPTFRVRRAAPAGGADVFDSLAAACAAAPADRETVIEIDDNGPFFEPPIAVEGRSLVVRSATGRRALVVWDPRHPASVQADRFLWVSGATLTLKDLDIGVKTADTGQPDAWAVVCATNGDVAAEGCTISVAGKHGAGVAAVRLEGNRLQSPGKCRLTRCLLRGDPLVALDLRAPGAEALMDGCLAVGSERPLVAVGGSRSLTPPTVRILRSTLVAGRGLVRVEPTGPAGTARELRCHAWDSLLARTGAAGEEPMVRLGEGITEGAVEWRAVNCLYCGWTTLLACPGHVIKDFKDWRASVQGAEGDAALPSPWPPGGAARPASATPSEFRTDGTPAFYAAVLGPGPLGCELRSLPPAREGWLVSSFEPVVRPLVRPQGGPEPVIPRSPDGRYAGETITLTAALDLGAHLREKQQQSGLAPQVVLHLSGSGDFFTSPIRLQGTSLWLYTPPPESGKPPLTLLPREDRQAPAEAMIHVEDSNLTIENLALRVPNRWSPGLPAHLVKVRDGDLNLIGCRLEGRPAPPADGYRGLVAFESSGARPPDRSPACVLADSVLVGGKALLRLAGAGADCRLENCALAALEAALEIAPAPSPAGRRPLTCSLDHNTVAVRGSLLSLAPSAARDAAAEPAVVAARANVLAAPFATDRAGLLRFEEGALAQGLLLWRGEGNLFDKRLAFAALPGSAVPPDKAAALPAWLRLWGHGGELAPIDQTLTASLHLDRPLAPQLGTVTVPATLQVKPPPGANFTPLGLVKKPARPKAPPK
jgi:serine/threonine-protein kinase